MVLSTPALKAIKNVFPHSKLTVLASTVNADILINNPNVNEIIVLQSHRITEYYRTIKLLRNIKFDMAIDSYADYELKTAVIQRLTGAQIRIGFESYGRGVFFNFFVSKPREEKHFVDQTLDVLSPLKVKMIDKTPEIFLTKEEIKWSSEWLEAKNLGQKPILGIHPGAYFESQRWPDTYFAELIDNLKAEKKYDIIMFGGPGDRDLLERINSMAHVDVPKFSNPNLRQFLALLSCCTMFVCNNSGPLHMAVALKVPTVSFMGPTNKNRWMPLGDIHKVLRVDDLPCIGCNLGYCKIKTHECMKRITPSHVLNSIKMSLLENNQSSFYISNDSN